MSRSNKPPDRILLSPAAVPWAPLSLALLCVVGGLACGPGVAGQATNAAINTGIAAGASAVRRSGGDCYTPCDHGTVCNPETGYCDPLPCGRICDEGERCDTTRPFPRCERDIEFTPEIAAED